MYELEKCYRSGIKSRLHWQDIHDLCHITKYLTNAQ